MVEWSEREKAVIELLKQKKQYKAFFSVLKLFRRPSLNQTMQSSVSGGGTKTLEDLTESFSYLERS